MALYDPDAGPSLGGGGHLDGCPSLLDGRDPRWDSCTCNTRKMRTTAEELSAEESELRSQAWDNYRNGWPYKDHENDPDPLD